MLGFSKFKQLITKTVPAATHWVIRNEAGEYVASAFNAGTASEALDEFAVYNGYADIGAMRRDLQASGDWSELTAARA